MPLPEPLPIDEIRAPLAAAVRQAGAFVLEAPTGSGKSTRVPQFLLDDGLVPRGKVVVLQPRRLPARVLARRVAWERGSRPGDEVGWQVRFERVHGPSTRLLYVTEGVLPRWLADEPDLPGVGAVLFDEFHERHLDGDVTLARLRDLRATRRPDLVLGVLSATLDAAPVAAYLGGCPRVRSEGRMFPVEIRHRSGGRVDDAPWDIAAEAAAELVEADEPGDLLIFMPGAAEIHRCLRRLAEIPATRRCRCVPLYGDLPPDQQDAALEPGPERRIIVSTNVAETSLTIPGVRLVVDAGLARVPCHDPSRGIETVLVEKISRASADQRAGRAGRTAPGVCVRLWSAKDHAHRAAHTPPEVARRDLAGTVLDLAVAGVRDPAAFPWFEAPEPDRLAAAVDTLHLLGALAPDGAPTGVGRAMADFPLPPRHARLLLGAAHEGVLAEACVAIATLQGRPLLTPQADPRGDRELSSILDAEPEAAHSDLWFSLRVLELARRQRFDPDWGRRVGVHAGAAREAEAVAQQLRGVAESSLRRSGWQEPPRPSSPAAALRRAVLGAFADRVARRLDRGTLRCELVGGRRGDLRRGSVVHDAPLLVVTDIEERTVRGDATVLLGGAVAIEESWLAEDVPGAVTTADTTALDPIQKRVVVRRARRYRDLVLESRETGLAPPEGEAAAILATEVLEGRLEIRGWDDSVTLWTRRLNLVAKACPDYAFPAFGEEERRLVVEQLCLGATSFRDVRERDPWPVLRDLLGPGQAEQLERLAPERWELPGGFRARLDYREDGTVVLAAKVQQLYGTEDRHPAIADGRVPLLVEVLAPSHRPVQVTRDLPGFWTTSYPEVRKQLRGRYPKHEWR